MVNSGGLQNEAYFFDKYCITMSDETEWVELIENGLNILTVSDYDRIMNAFEKVHAMPRGDFKKRLYGKGNAGEIIPHELLS